MRCATVAQIKQPRGGRSAPTNLIPREGTRTREIYDALTSNRGRPTQLNLARGGDRMVACLQDFYGLDIRQVQRGNRRTGRPSLWVLAGEWFGRVYVDYVAEHINSESGDAA